MFGHKKARLGMNGHLWALCGERGIRTPGTRKGSTVFKTAALDRSAISPNQWGAKIVYLMNYRCLYF